jgi:hypothetical protein
MMRNRSMNAQRQADKAALTFDFNLNLFDDFVFNEALLTVFHDVL